MRRIENHLFSARSGIASKFLRQPKQGGPVSNAPGFFSNGRPSASCSSVFDAKKSPVKTGFFWNLRRKIFPKKIVAYLKSFDTFAHSRLGKHYGISNCENILYANRFCNCCEYEQKTSQKTSGDHRGQGKSAPGCDDCLHLGKLFE